MNIKRGALIVLEGVDRSGKSTQARKLVESLVKRNIPAELMMFPDRSTHIGKLISQYLSNKDYKLDDRAIHLLFSANRWENVGKIKKSIFRGITLIVDRYSYSGMAFSSAKADMSLEWCMQPERGLPKPDLVFLLTLDQEQMTTRPGFGNERYETLDFQKRVADVYQRLRDDTWKEINASGSIDDVQKLLLETVIQKIDEVGIAPLGSLNFNAIECSDKKNGEH